MVRSTASPGIGVLLLGIAALVATQVRPALAGVPDPARAGDGVGIPCVPADRSYWDLEPAPTSCQYRFAADGSLDELVVVVTLRDCFDTPIAFCAMESTLKPDPGTVAFCSCESPLQAGVTDADGAVEFRYSRIGGRGSLSVALTVQCAGSIGFPDLDVEFTSPDLNGSCEPGASTTVADLGVWAAGLSGYVQASDFDCNGFITISDLGLWARGLGIGCP